MEAKSVLEEFRRRRKLLENLRPTTATARLGEMWNFLNKIIETKKIIKSIKSVEPLIKAGKAKDAKTYEEIAGVGIHILEECNEGEHITKIVGDLDIGVKHPKPTQQSYTNDAGEFVNKALDFIEEKLEELVATESKQKSTQSSSGQKKAAEIIFISHAAEDAVLAETVKTQIDNVFEKKINVFVSSIPGTIRPGSDWFNKIVGNLTENNAFVVLVTPYSEKRPFVWFEIGFSWFRRLNKNCEIYAICAPPINPGNLPEPLCRLQAISLGEEKQTKAFFTELIKQFSLGNLDALEFAKIRDSLPTYPSQITQTENIDISDEAKELLIEASQSPDGRIMRLRTMRGLTIQTNKKGFVSERNARLEAIWEDALNQLIENSLIEDKGYKGEVFAVTRLGYEYADTLKKDADILQDKSSAGTSASIQQDDLEFEKASGTYISKEDSIRYCHKCLHSSSQRIPLKEQKNGWRCNVCDKFYPNPNYDRPTHTRNKRDPMMM